MTNTTRAIVALICIAASAALATPELAAKLPPYVSTALAAGVAAVLQQLRPVGDKGEQLPPPPKGDAP